MVRDRDGNLITELEKIALVCQDYCGDLFADPGAPRYKLHNFEKEPDILLSEVEAAVAKLREGKAVGIGRISSEVLRALDERGLQILHHLCQRIWQTGQWPKDWTTSLLLPLHKKGPAEVCNNYRLIALIAHASKITLYVLQCRLSAFLNPHIAPEQAGFVKDRETRNKF